MGQTCPNGILRKIQSRRIPFGRKRVLKEKLFVLLEFKETRKGRLTILKALDEFRMIEILHKIEVCRSPDLLGHAGLSLKQASQGPRAP